MAPGTPPLTLHPVSDPLTHGGAVAVCLVRDAQGHTVGSLKRIGAVWKFKAIGHGPQGTVAFSRTQLLQTLRMGHRDAQQRFGRTGR